MVGFSVLIPVYNEEEIMIKNVDTLIEYLKGLEESFEIIVIDNGSTDRTKELGKLLKRKYQNKFKFISIPQRGWVGHAFKVGVLNSNYRKIVSMDMDLSVDVSFIPKCVELLEHYSMIIGSKMVGKQDRKWYRIWMSSIFIYLTKLFLGLQYNDYSMSAKGYRKEDILIYLGHIDRGSAYVFELAYWLARHGNMIKQLPVICSDNRKSRFNIIYEASYRLFSLLKLKFFASKVSD